MKHPLFALILSGLLASCAQKATSNLPVLPEPPRNTTHLVEVAFNGVGTAQPTSSAKTLQSSGLQKQGLQTVTGELQFTSLSTSTFTVKRTGTRFVTATYQITNNTGRTLHDLGLVGVALNDTDGDASNNSVSPTAQGTAFRSLKHYDGSDASEKAPVLVPGTAQKYDYRSDSAVADDSGTVYRSGLDLNGFTPAAPSGLTMNVQDFGWFLEGDFPSGTSQVVTFSVAFPMDADPRNDPYSFSFVATYSENVLPEPTQFVTLGGALNVSPDASRPFIAVDQNNTPVVSYMEWFNDIGTVTQVKRWNGSTWDAYPVPFNSATEGAREPSVALTPSGNPVVMAQTYGGRGLALAVKRWNGNSWDDLGTAVELDDMHMHLDTGSMQLAVAPDGAPVVVYTGMKADYSTPSDELHVLKYQTGTGWVDLGGALNFGQYHYLEFPSVAFNTSGQPVVAWAEAVDNQSGDVWVKAWNGTSWTQLGGPLDVNQSHHVLNTSVAVGKNNVPVVGWSEYGNDYNANVHVKRWDGNTWVQLGGPLDSVETRQAYQPTVVVDSSNRPVVSWYEEMGNGLQYHVKRWNGNTWDTLLSPVHPESSAAYDYMRMAAGPNNSVSVVWNQYSASTANQSQILVKRFE
ncbi:hypothetical protein [Deinococcus cellulosilyticus]|uniref:Uncharacterized protein n=1 Tax=Deinococcus cellulosilyticus (strain DSM 18568 / NBRC 106333 / KACC 11606 / 5516J-15) TaxID=1223518 RepID=A0A511NA62_DEIC1|nr:hypothetical protein [Deinococcus cellulosilyticus]GEM49261.1 hypothetical protein DC3_48960 [Deinococcus cellulosilyticus NBRC 106333 = KACC 11606]